MMRKIIGVAVPVIAGAAAGLTFNSVLLGLIVATLLALAIGEM